MMLVVALVASSNARGAPHVKFLIPAGGKTGTMVEVTAAGDFPEWPVRAWVNAPGLNIVSGEEKGKLLVNIGADTSPGLYWVRLYDNSGAAAPRPFIVGLTAEASEQEPNNSIGDAQVVSAASKTGPLTINGQLGASGDVDVYAIRASQGETLVADLDAHTPLRSPVDAVLQIVSPDGFVHAQNDDQLLLDPRLAVKVPRDGLWHVRLFGFPETPTNRIRFAGDPTYVYRLTLSTGPCLEYAIPMAAHRHDVTRIRLFGWNLTPAMTWLEVGPDIEADELPLVRRNLVSTLRVPVVSDNVLVEAEPNSQHEPHAVELPAVITGRIEQPGDRDVFSFSGREHQTVSARLESRALGFPLDAVLELTDASGKQLARVDDSGGSRDAQLEYESKSDAELRLVVNDLHRNGGHRFVYRLAIHWARPEFSLSLKEHQIAVDAGGETELSVAIERRHGHDSPIAISVQGLPDGISAMAMTSVIGDNTKNEIKLKLSAQPDAAAAGVPVRIVGVADENVRQFASIAVPTSHGPLLDLWLTVTARSP